MSDEKLEREVMKLQGEMERLEAEFRSILDSVRVALQKNLSHAGYKDEQSLLEAFKLVDGSIARRGFKVPQENLSPEEEVEYYQHQNKVLLHLLSQAHGKLAEVYSSNGWLNTGVARVERKAWNAAIDACVARFSNETLADEIRKLKKMPDGQEE